MEKTARFTILLIMATALVCNCVALKCEFYNQTEDHTYVDTCKLDKESAYCYAVWHNNTLLNKVVIKFKGCTYRQECKQNIECVNRDSLVYSTFLQSCCCDGDNCNSIIIWDPDTINTEPSDRNKMYKALYETAGYFIVLCCIYAAYNRRKIYTFIQGLFSNGNTNSYGRSSINAPLEMNNEILSPNHFSRLNHLPNVNLPKELDEIQSTSSLELVEEISRGRYGVVWKALHKNNTVAVKIFSPQDKSSWLIEQEIYQLPHMHHDNIVFFIGVEERPSDIDAAKNEYLLITAYHDCGSLCDYLKSNTLTWSQLCLITHSMASGLMHLHEEILSERLDQYKPIIFHRDFKSKNVLLKHDFTACISDFSVAMVLRHGMLCGDVHTQVGTPRYMAPEVLNGSIDYSRDTFLSVDMYACGLILWELATRCTVQLGDVQEYRLPFEEEVGQHPSLKDMIECVVHKRLRPTFKDNWNKSHQGLIDLCDTMEECWEHCAEDRLSAGCIVERCFTWSIYN